MIRKSLTPVAYGLLIVSIIFITIGTVALLASNRLFRYIDEEKHDKN